MKNKKILIIAPILLVICAVGVLLIRESYSAPDDTMAIDTAAVKQKNYYYIRRNMLSHHFITSNYDPSGTILLKAGNPDSTTGRRVIVYCAHKGKNISRTSQGKHYKNVPIAKTSVSALKKAKNRLIGVMTNSYPYISLDELKKRIKAGIGEADYNKFKFDTLDAQEAMTATQASIWNAIDNKVNNKYRTTESIGSIKYAYFHNTSNNPWPLNWDKTSTYNINKGCYNGTGSNHDCGSKSTYLAPGDTAKTAGTYKKNNSKTLVEKRINRLINWYFTLKESQAADDIMPEFGIQQETVKWEDDGHTLNVTVLANNDKYSYEGTSYEVAFTDLNGKALTPESSEPVTNGSKIIGYKYVIRNIETNGVLGTASATIPSTASSVYVYEAAGVSYKNTQYLIGVEDGSIPIEKPLQILNDSKGKVYIYKTALKSDSSEPQVSVTTGKTLDGVCNDSNPCQAGADFVIYAQDKQTVLKEFESSTEPIEIDLPVGTYYIQEVAAPVGYSFNSIMQEFKIEDDNSIVSVHYQNLPTKICIKKVSTEAPDTTLDGATLQLQSMVGGVYEDFTTYSQEEKGMYCTVPAQLPVGIYYIVETNAPANFVKTNTKYRIKVGNFENNDGLAEERDFGDGSNVVDLPLKEVNGVYNVAVIENKPGTVITKSDLATGGCVSGAHLVVRDSKGQKKDEWTSSCEAGKDNHEIKLDEGSYTLTEEITPSGYATAESIEFTIDSKGKVDTSLDMKDAPIEACFIKVSENNDEGLSGAEFEIYDSKGKLYNTFTSTTSETCFQYMPAGKYTLKETKAPKGYQKLEKPIEIEIKDTSETQTFEINNEVEAPKTDLDSSKLVIIIASIFMIFGLGLVGYYGYKKQV